MTPTKNLAVSLLGLGLGLGLGLWCAASAIWVAVPRAEAAGTTARWECTRIKVPESTNLPVRMSDGTLIAPPTQLSPAFKPFLSTVQLPEGFIPQGGGDGSVIACKQGG